MPGYKQHYHSHHGSGRNNKKIYAPRIISRLKIEASTHRRREQLFDPKLEGLPRWETAPDVFCSLFRLRAERENAQSLLSSFWVLIPIPWPQCLSNKSHPSPITCLPQDFWNCLSQFNYIDLTYFPWPI